MIKEINVNPKDYPENIKVKCEKCRSQLLLMVHKDFKGKNCVLGCAFCGHSNKISFKK